MNRAPFVRSRYTLAEHWPDGRGILLNAFTGAVDIVPDSVVDFVAESKETQLGEDDPLYETLIDRGYYVESREVEETVARAVAKRAKANAVAASDIKYMFGLTLKCNLTCKYCWQVIEHGQARQKTKLMSEEVVEAAFEFIDEDMQRRGKQRAFISLFGGEPLIDTPRFHQLVRHIGRRTKQRGFHLHFTTNGRDLAKYRAETEEFSPSIQVTVDGVSFEGGLPVLSRAGQPLTGVYEEIMALARKRVSRIFLRFLATCDSVPSFVALADHLAAEIGLDGALTLAVAPVQNKTTEIDERIPPKFQVLSALMAALKGRSYTSHISFIDWRSLGLFNGLRVGEDSLPPAAFFHCEANVDLTCFDQDGLLYACYEGIGDPRFSVGRFWPERELDEAHLAQYRDRSAFSMPQCTACALSPICGGGCEVRGYKKNDTYMHPYCDALHEEARLVLRHWPEVSELLTGARDATEN